MTPLFFGPPARRLFGLFHPAERVMPGAEPVLLCNPYGHEAVRMHRFYRLLATRLSRAGIPVLRFDYHATGDSPGEDEDGDMEGWALDVLSAHHELLSRANANRARWFACRLGATTAFRAALLGDAKPSWLLAWEPIVNGAAYVAELRRRHVEMLDVSYFVPRPAWRRALRHTRPNAPLTEALGFGINPVLSTQLWTLTTETVRVSTTPITVLARATDAELHDWIVAEGRRDPRSCVAAQDLEHQLIWTSNPHPDNELVPMGALQQIATLLQAHRHPEETVS